MRFALLWKHDVEMKVVNFSSHHINAIIRSEAKNVPWLFSRFYGNPETCKRRVLKALVYVEPTF